MLKQLVALTLFCGLAFAKLPIYAPEDGTIGDYLGNLGFFRYIDEEEKYEACMENNSSKEKNKKDEYCKPKPFVFFKYFRKELYEICMKNPLSKEKNKKDEYCKPRVSIIMFYPNNKKNRSRLYYLSKEVLKPTAEEGEEVILTVKKGQLIGYASNEADRDGDEIPPIPKGMTYGSLMNSLIAKHI